MVARRASTVLNFWSGNNIACVRGGAAVHMLAIIGKVTDFSHKYVKGFGIFLDLDSHSLHAAHSSNAPLVPKVVSHARYTFPG